MANKWLADDCPTCGEVRLYEPHTEAECLKNLFNKVKDLEKMFHYLRETKEDKPPKKVKK